MLFNYPPDQFKTPPMAVEFFISDTYTKYNNFLLLMMPGVGLRADQPRRRNYHHLFYFFENNTFYKMGDLYLAKLRSERYSSPRICWRNTKIFSETDSVLKVWLLSIILCITNASQLPLFCSQNRSIKCQKRIIENHRKNGIRPEKMYFCRLRWCPWLSGLSWSAPGHWILNFWITRNRRSLWVSFFSC